MIIVETPRLILRTWKAEDEAVLARISADPVVMEHFLATQTAAETRQFLDKINQHYQKYGYTLYAVELKATGEVIGFTGLLKVGFEAHFTPAVEIGWRLAKEHWGNGYAPEAAKAVLKMAFEKFNLEKVVSFTAATNKNSQRVMQKIGLQYDSKDDFKHPKLPADHPLCEHVLYQLSKEVYHAK
jgi:RimJ/RimL family protein N-acetyltransferase